MKLYGYKYMCSYLTTQIIFKNFTYIWQSLLFYFRQIGIFTSLFPLESHRDKVQIYLCAYHAHGLDGAKANPQIG